MSDDAIVYLVDDDDSVRKAVSRLLRAAGLTVESFACAEEFLNHDRLDRPSCLLLDIQMPGLSGMELQDRLCASHVSLPIVFLTGHGDIPKTVEAMKAGAVDFLPKPVSDEKLLNVVDGAIEKHRLELEQGAETREFQARIETLTRREHEVLLRVIAGRLNKQIASELGITETTVKVHRGRVMKKAGVESLAELVRLHEKLEASSPV